jgi:hypothetical protein
VSCSITVIDSPTILDHPRVYPYTRLSAIAVPYCSTEKEQEQQLILSVAYSVITALLAYDLVLS